MEVGGKGILPSSPSMMRKEGVRVLVCPGINRAAGDPFERLPLPLSPLSLDFSILYILK